MNTAICVQGVHGTSQGSLVKWHRLPNGEIWIDPENGIPDQLTINLFLRCFKDHEGTSVLDLTYEYKDSNIYRELPNNQFLEFHVVAEWRGDAYGIDLSTHFRTHYVKGGQDGQ